MSDSIALHPVFEKNLQALFHKNAPLAAKLFAMQGHERFEVFIGKDPIDINLLDMELESFMYANPVNDMIAIGETLNLGDHIPFRYFFGLGNGIALKLLFQSKNLHRVVVVEPQAEIFYIIFHIIDFSDEIISGKVIFDSLDAMDFSRAVTYLSHPEGKIFAKLFSLETFSPYYEHYYAHDIKHLGQVMIEAIHAVIIGHGNDPIDSLMGIEHHIKNLPRMVEGPKLLELIEQDASDTIVIVSTGPSLTKQLPLLKKIQDHVTIVSVDASFPILEKNGIKPDFVSILERVPETAKFFVDNAPSFQQDVNFLCVSIAHEDTVNAIAHGNLTLLMRPHNYTKYFELNDYGYLGVGMSAANLAHEYAINLNPKQIIFIGQDLAFGDDNTSHAQDHTFTVNEEKIEGHDIFIEKYGGGGTVRTTQYWVLFKNYIERAIAETAHRITTINSTEGGARIPGSVELSFSDAINQYVNFEIRKPKIVPQNTSLAEAARHKEKIIDKINFWIRDSIQKQEIIEEAFLNVQHASEKFVEMKEKENLDTIEQDELIDLMDEIDHVKSLIDSAGEGAGLYFDTIQSFLLHYELELAKTMIRPVRSQEEKTAKMVEWIMQHRYWLFSVAGSINAERLTVIRALEAWPAEMKEKIVIPVKKEIEVDQEKYEKLLEKVRLENLNLITLDPHYSED
jgi:hypothetical protein